MSKRLIYPKPLIKKSTIGLICPAGGFDDYKPVRLVTEYLKQQGFNVKVGKSIVVPNKSSKYLSGTDEMRLNDLHNFWADDAIDAIFCLRGGYGSLRLLKEINYKLIQNNPKIFIGFSDITALHLAIYAKTNLITFHGPLLGIRFLNTNLSPKNKTSELHMWRLLQAPKCKFSYLNRSYGSVVYPGECKGVLLGGNLTDICSMIGSGLLPDFKNSVLFLEDCNEEPYKIDRLLTQLCNAGILASVKGVLFSSFYKCGFKNNKEIVSLLKTLLKPYKIPSVYGFPIGHGLKNYAVPVGAPVIFNANSISLNSCYN